MRPDSLSTSRTPDLVASERDAGCRHDALIAEPRLIQKSKKYLMKARSRYGPTARAWPMLCSTQTEFLRGANLQDQNFKTTFESEVLHSSAVAIPLQRSSFFIRLGG